MSQFPEIYLAVDNCFASKRWTAPEDWMREVGGAGLTYIEASADTELDPLYLGAAYLKRWVSSVKEAEAKSGCHVTNLYSGHGTYATLGLAHTDEEVRGRFLERWLKPMVDVAHDVGAGFGFFCHAFPQRVLADQRAYDSATNDLVASLSELASYNASLPGECEIGVEQMYTPHQVPWTIAQAHELLRRVWDAGGSPFYLTIDVGHQSGQHRFRMPEISVLTNAILVVRGGGMLPKDIWLGPDEERERFVLRAQDDSQSADELTRETLHRLSAYPYLFSRAGDSDPYRWLRELAGWSPIIHLQQTEQTTSSHSPFNEETNATGIIHGKDVLQAIYDHYRDAPNGVTPGSEGSGAEAGVTGGQRTGSSATTVVRSGSPRVTKIYLTLEIFAGTAETPEEIRRKIRDSVSYWREFVPEDGMTVDALIERIGGCL